MRRESEWKVNSKEQYRKEDSRKGEGECDWREEKNKIMSGQKIEDYTRKKAAEMQMIGLQATKLYLEIEEAYFSVVFFLSCPFLVLLS